MAVTDMYRVLISREFAIDLYGNPSDMVSGDGSHGAR